MKKLIIIAFVILIILLAGYYFGLRYTDTTNVVELYKSIQKGYISKGEAEKVIRERDEVKQFMESYENNEEKYNFIVKGKNSEVWYVLVYGVLIEAGDSVPSPMVLRPFNVYQIDKVSGDVNCTYLEISADGTTRKNNTNKECISPEFESFF